MTVSTNYRKLDPREVDAVALECAEAWQSELIPWRQYDVVKPELESFSNGTPLPVYDAFIRCMQKIPPQSNLLDIGAAGAHYGRILQLAGFHLGYTAFDFAESFQRFARTIYPDVNYVVGDARRLPYHDDHFDIVLHSACLMHIREYAQAVKEAARVTRKYVIFHRTPVFTEQETSFYIKDGYGVPMFEIHFNEAELIRLFQANGLDVVYTTDVFWTEAEGFGHRDYLLAKQPGLFHIQV